MLLNSGRILLPAASAGLRPVLLLHRGQGDKGVAKALWELEGTSCRDLRQRNGDRPLVLGLRLLHAGVPISPKATVDPICGSFLHSQIVCPIRTKWLIFTTKFKVLRIT